MTHSGFIVTLTETVGLHLVLIFDLYFLLKYFDIRETKLCSFLQILRRYYTESYSAVRELPHASRKVDSGYIDPGST